ncbi:MAG TPA: serine hydrolase domain-containing protein [Solirubrobacteraceae bacterium]|nr:serine hydrolase domain-containing protein [Solirubrobacteraceae bacterium]
MDVRGLCPEKFDRVRAVFAAHFDQDLELGARFALAIEGEIVVDLLGGFADRARTRPFAEDTLTSVFSTTKAMAALMVATLIDVGELSYDQPLSELWPEFAAAGKGGITIGEALSHQAGLPGFLTPMAASDWFDFALIAEKLAAMSPMWPPASASGYHPVTFGYLAGEIFRRVDGRDLGAALAEDLARPFGLDLWIGLPDSEHPRCAEMRKPPATPNLGPITDARRAAFLTPWASPGGVSLDEWRRAAIPSVTGHATAPALARMMAILACDGRLDGRQLLSPSTVAEASRERIRGPDRVLPHDLAWGAGFLRNEGLFIYGPGEATVGHSGWGGSCAFADPERRLSGAYVMNRQSAELVADARAMALIEAVYASM